jgi:hypothetical protein
MKYEFKDTFIKSCQDNVCNNTRESYKCIDDKCEKVDFFTDKKEILENYYQHGSGKSHKYIFKCKLCDFKSSKFEKYTKHIKTHVQHGSGKSHKYIFKCKLCDFKSSKSEKYIKHSATHIKTHLNEQKTKMLNKLKMDKMDEDWFKIQKGSGKRQFYGKKSSVMVKVPEQVKRVAEISFKLKKLGFKGGLETGWKRAKQLATKKEIPIQDIKYMKAWFARHVYASYPTYKKWKKDGKPKTKDQFSKRGIISWMIWGGSPAYKWVNSKKINSLLNKN